MTTRLAAAITAAILFGGMLYSLSGSPTLDAQAQGVVCATPTPTITPTLEAGLPTPTSTPPPGGSIPAFPMVFSGSATVAGNPIPDCTFLYAMIGEAVSGLAPIIDGKFTGLAIGALNESENGRPVTFHLSEDVVAEETQRYIYTQSPPNPPSLMFKDGITLTFPHLVTPSPTPTPIVDSPTPTATPTPTVELPTSTPTPLTADPAIYSGVLTIAGLTAVPPGSVLTARIGSSYQSLPAAIVGRNYESLVVAPSSSSFIGQPVEFFLNGFKSVSLDTFESGARRADFEIIFIGYPTPTSEPTGIPPTNTPEPTPTPVPPTNTPVPTQTPVPPTNTPIPTPTPTVTTTPPPMPTATLRPTRTPIPKLVPTNTPESTDKSPSPIVQVVTATPSPTPEPQGGLCSFAGPVPLSAGIGSLLMLIAPVGLLYGVRRARS